MFKKLFITTVVCFSSIAAFAGGAPPVPSEGLLFSQPFANNSFTSFKAGTAAGISFIQTTTGSLTTTSNPILTNEVLSFGGKGFVVASLTGTGITSTAFGIAMNVVFSTVTGAGNQFTQKRIFEFKPSGSNTTFELSYQTYGAINMTAWENHFTSSNYTGYSAAIPNLGVGTVSGAVHIAVTWELGKPLNVYMDGRVMISFTPSFVPVAAPTLVYFGGSPIFNGSETYSFMGTMDNITMYNRYLTTTDVRLIYDAFSAIPLTTCTSAPSMPTGIVKSIDDCTPTATEVNITPPSVTNAANLAEGFYFTNGSTTFTGARFNSDPRLGGLGGFSQPDVTDFGTYTGVAYNACGSSSVTIVKEAPLPEITSFSVRTITGGYEVYVGSYNNLEPDYVLYFSNKKTIEKNGDGGSKDKRTESTSTEANKLSQYCNTATGICYDGLSIISPDNNDFVAVYKTIIQSCGNTFAGPSFQISVNPTTGILSVTTVPANTLSLAVTGISASGSLANIVNATLITLTGTGFVTGATVTVGGVVLTNVQVNGNVITGTIPAGSTVVNPTNPTVLIQNPGRPVVSVPVVTNTTSLNSPFSILNYQLYPNPAQNQITVVGNVGSIEIYNYIGTTVYTGKDTTIDVSGFVNGLYVVKSGSSVLKFVKE